MFGIPMKAAGGFIPAGQATLVGENGPEIFTPPAGGQVTPNGMTNAMSSGGGGDTHNHYYNIQAVDAKSVAQLFAENRTTMFGMVEQARREMPMRTR
jgi:phage-related minor tail protein